MVLTPEYIAVVLNTVIRQTAPILYVALAATICSKVQVFNIGLEGTMLAGAFFSIFVNYYTGNVILSVLAACLVGMMISFIVAFFIVRLKAYALVVGLAINSILTGLTTFLMSYFFGVKGVFSDPSLVGLHKLTLPGISRIPLVGTVFSSLTVLDYLVFILAVCLYVFFYKMRHGFRLRAIGIDTEAARSLGTPVDRYRISAVGLSGILTGLGGCLLSMGSVTLFMQGMTSGRGYIALAADSLGLNHPIAVMVSSLFFGFCQAMGSTLQNTSLKSQLTSIIPYAATIIALAVFRTRTKNSRRYL